MCALFFSIAGSGIVSIRPQRLDFMSSPSPSYVTHYWPLNPISSGVRDLTLFERATLLESQVMIEQGTTGLKTWPAGIALANYLVMIPSDCFSIHVNQGLTVTVCSVGIVNNKRVLELGSGTGFLGIIIATLQIQQSGIPSDTNGSLWLTDINEEVLARCHHNLRLPCSKRLGDFTVVHPDSVSEDRSSSHPNIQCRTLDWFAALNADEKPSLDSLLSKIDSNVVLGADIVC
jgi:protein-lysine N-methyltransferase EEF2KMT